MTSGGGRHNFDDYTIMHSVRVASLEPVKESFVSWLRGIVTLSTGFRRGKKKKIVCPDEVFFSFFRFSGSSSHIMRARQRVIIEQQFITPLDRSMGKTRDLPLPQVFLLSRQRQLEIYGFHATTTTLIIVSKTMLLSRAARNSWRQVNRCSVVSKVRSVLNSVKKRLFVRSLF